MILQIQNNKLIISVPLGISTTCRQCCFAVQSSKSNLVLMQICQVLSLCQKSERFIYQTANQLLKNYSSACSAPFPHPSIFVYLFVFLVFDVMEEESSPPTIKFVAGECANSSDDSLAAVLTLDRLRFHNQLRSLLSCFVDECSRLPTRKFTSETGKSTRILMQDLSCWHRLEGKQNNRQLSPNESKIKANTQLAFDCLCHHSFQHFNWIFDLISIGLLCRIECHWRNVADCEKSRSSLSVDDWGGNVMSANMCGCL